MTVERTLGFYRDMACLLNGPNSRAVKFFDAKIAEQGRDEKVLASESQMLLLIQNMYDPEASP